MRTTRWHRLMTAVAGITIASSIAVIGQPEPTYADEPDPNTTETQTYVQIMSDDEIARYLAGHPEGLPLEQAFQEQSTAMNAPDISDTGSATGAIDNAPDAGSVPTPEDLDLPTLGDVPTSPADLADPDLSSPDPGELGTTPLTVGSGPCAFLTDGDKVHRTDGRASAHGYWYNVNCASGTLANVTNWIAVKRQGSYYVMAQGYKANVQPGGGRGRRSTAKYTCKSSKLRYWINLIDVDLVGQADSNEVAQTDPRIASCN